MPKGEYLIVPKGTKFTGSGKLGLRKNTSKQKSFAQFRTHFTPLFCEIEEFEKWPLNTPKRIQKGPFISK